MKVHCPGCGEPVAAGEVDLASGWGKCLVCHEIFSLQRVLPGYSVGTAAAAVLARPFNARAELDRTSDELKVFIPAEGMRAGTWALLGFAVFWLSFIAFWTSGALGFFGQGGGNGGPIQWAFAAFSIPFWIVGFFMLGSVTWMARGTRTIAIDGDGLTTSWRCGYFGRTRWIERDQVQHARPHTPKLRSNHDSASETLFAVEIIYHDGSFVLPTDSFDEQEWLMREINEFLGV